MTLDNFNMAMKAIGVLILTVILFAIPILTPISIIFNWHDVIKVVLSVATILEFIITFCIILFTTDKN